MDKEHKIHHKNTSSSNIILLFGMFDKNQFVGILIVQIVDRFSESI